MCKVIYIIITWEGGGMRWAPSAEISYVLLRHQLGSILVTDASLEDKDGPAMVMIRFARCCCTLSMYLYVPHCGTSYHAAMDAACLQLPCDVWSIFMCLYISYGRYRLTRCHSSSSPTASPGASFPWGMPPRFPSPSRYVLFVRITMHLMPPPIASDYT